MSPEQPPTKILMIVRAHGTNSELYIEGQRVEGLTSMQLGRISVGKPVTLLLEFAKAEFEIRGEVERVEVGRERIEIERAMKSGALDRVLATFGLRRSGKS
jgi:hypothetical protein